MHLYYTEAKMLLAQVDFSQESTFAPARIKSLSTLFNVILPLLTLGAAILFLSMCLYGAFLILTGGDTPDRIKKGQQTLTFAGLGLVIVLAAFIIVKLIGLVLGVNNILPI